LLQPERNTVHLSFNVVGRSEIDTSQSVVGQNHYIEGS